MQPLVRFWRRLPRQQLAIYLFYLALAVLITWPLVTVLSTRLLGDDQSDAYEMIRHIWWFKYALQNGEPLFFQPLLGYPDGITGVSLWADPLQFFPGWLFAFFMPLAAAYNLMTLLTMALNGWAMYWLARYLLWDDMRDGLIASPTVSSPDNSISLPALLAGVIFMAFPTFQGHLLGGHPGLIVMWPVPLFLYAVFRLLEKPIIGRRKWFALAVLFFVMSPGGHALQLIFVLMPIVGLLMLTLLYKRNWLGLWYVTGISLVGGLLLLAFLLPVIGETVETPVYVEEASTAVRYSIDLLGIVSPSFEHSLFWRLDYTRQVLGINLVEGFTYVGLIAGVLGLLGVVRIRAARWWLLLGAIAWIFALGPLLKILDQPLVVKIGSYESYIPLPFALIQNLPFFNLARTPGRFTFVLALAVAMMAAYGASVIFRQRIARYRAAYGVAFVLLTLGVVWEYQIFPTMPTTLSDIPENIVALRDRTDIRAILNLPWNNLPASKEAIFHQTVHHIPLIAGHVTRQTPVDPAKLSILQATLDSALLDAAGADLVMVYKYWDDPSVIGPIEAATREKLGAPSFENDRVAVFEVPDSTPPPQFVALPAADSGYAANTNAYFYVPEPGWVEFSVSLQADGRDAVIYLDGTMLHRQNINGETPMIVSLPVIEAGYHTVTLALDPICPHFHNISLACRALTVRGMQFEMIAAGIPVAPIPLSNGAELLSAFVVEQANAGDTLEVGLWWQFDAELTENDVRFLHVLDEEGRDIVQNDVSLGARPDDSQWAEQVDLLLPENLPAGTYTVYAGWYTYPDTTRAEVLAETAGAENGLVYVGTFEVLDNPSP